MVFKVRDELLPQLLVKLEALFPYSYKEYSSLKNRLEGKWRGVDYYVDQWPDFTALVVRPDRANHQVKYSSNFHFVFGTNVNGVKEILSQPGFIDWTNNVVFSAVPSHLWSTIEEFLSNRNGRVEKQHEGAVHTITMEDLVLHPVPEGMTLRQMRRDEAHDVYAKNALYEGNPGIHEHCEALIENFQSLGLYSSSGEHIGHASQTQYGTLGFLCIKEKYRRQGYAKVIFSQLTKMLLEQGEKFVAIAITNDIAALRFHPRIGYKKIDFRTRWFRFFPF